MKKDRTLTLFFLPGFTGIIIFFAVPLVMVFCYSLTNVMQGEAGYGLTNYIRTVNNPMFRLGVNNFLIFLLIAVPSTAAISLGLAMLLKQAGRGVGFCLLILLLPFAVPSGSTAFFW